MIEIGAQKSQSGHIAWPSIGIGFGAENFFSETETFFFQNFSKFFKFFHVFMLPRGI